MSLLAPILKWQELQASSKPQYLDFSWNLCSREPGEFRMCVQPQASSELLLEMEQDQSSVIRKTEALQVKWLNQDMTVFAEGGRKMGFLI